MQHLDAFTSILHKTLVKIARLNYGVCSLLNKEVIVNF